MKLNKIEKRNATIRDPNGCGDVHLSNQALPDSRVPVGIFRLNLMSCNNLQKQS
jgi:hypothetical protein